MKMNALGTEAAYKEGIFEVLEVPYNTPLTEEQMTRLSWDTKGAKGAGKDTGIYIPLTEAERTVFLDEPMISVPNVNIVNETKKE